MQKKLNLFLAAFFLVAAVPVAAEVIKPPLDKSDYRYLKLDNGLSVMLVSDAQADKAAASLDISVGHGSDPEGREGMAHFLEHMLFLGTEKYPVAGEYQSFMKDHGGAHNAYTTYGNTNYFFSIQPEYLDGALNRFSQFFIAPLFNEDLVKRERVIVHSEYSARSTESGRRSWGARKMAMNPAHPRSRFSVGSLETLADRNGQSIRKELIDFYNSQYSANIMNLAVVGPQSLDELDSLVRERFSKVRNIDATRFVADVPMYRPEDLPLLQRIDPLRERRSVTFSFQLPSSRPHYPFRPMFQVANIIGHEAEGSLLQLLKQRGWAKGLSAGASSLDPAADLFEVRINLTEQGLQRIEEIGSLLFFQIDQIRQNGLEVWRHDEQRRLSELGFRFGERADPRGLATTLSARMHDYPWQDVLFAPFRTTDFDADLVRDYLALITPERVVVTLVAPGFDLSQEERWFQVKYDIEPLADTLLAAWKSPRADSYLALPEPNPFIPEDLAVADLSDVTEKPVQLMNSGGVELWHHTDLEFETPRSNLYFSVRSARAVGSPENMVLSDLFTSVIKDRLNAYSYPAYLAGLEYDLYPHLRGMSVRITGFSDRQPELLEQILAALRSGEFDAERVERVRNTLLQSYRNRSRERPADQAISEIQRLLLEQSWPIDSRIEALQAVTMENLKTFAAAYFDEINVLVLSHGSRSSSSAGQLASRVKDVLMDGSRPAEVHRSSVVRLKSDQHYQRPMAIDHQDSVVGIYQQGTVLDEHERARFAMLHQLMSADFYHQLRTNQKLGYVVQMGPLSVLDVPGIIYLIQSPTAGAHSVEAAMREFLSDFSGQLTSLDKDSFEHSRAALISRIDRQETNLIERTNRYWRELDEEDYSFSRRKRLATAVGELDLETMRNFYKRIQGGTSLVVWSPGSMEQTDPQKPLLNRVEIIEPLEFKKNHDLF